MKSMSTHIGSSSIAPSIQKLIVGSKISHLSNNPFWLRDIMITKSKKLSPKHNVECSILDIMSTYFTVLLAYLKNTYIFCHPRVPSCWPCASCTYFPGTWKYWWWQNAASKSPVNWLAAFTLRFIHPVAQPIDTTKTSLLVFTSGPMNLFLYEFAY